MNYKSNTFTVGELRQGFEKMPRPFPAAILFALETNLWPEQVVYLTRSEAKRIKLSPVATQIAATQPISIKTQYLFWREDEGSHLPLSELESLVFDVWGFVWAELTLNYSNIIWIDGDADFQDFEKKFEEVHKISIR